MTTPNMIAICIHCRKCGEEGRASKLGIGVTIAGDVLQIWCERHNMHVALLPLRDNIREIVATTCDICGQPFGPEHRH